MTQTDRRRKFVALECPSCGRTHDVLVDGGRHRIECGRLAEARSAGGRVDAQVWGVNGESGESPHMRRARLV